ncbi:MAG: CBS domain-containing protein [Ardenticatenaceae bacterium]|nr:CBS domain-containing protein [Ardenticatenaceae bacterium]
MSSPVVMVDSDDTVDDALHLMRQRQISSVLIRPAQAGGTYGIMTKRDVVGKVVSQGLDPGTVSVQEIMTPSIITIPVGTSLRECARLMAELRVRRLPVEQDGQIVGIISDTDIFLAVEEGGLGPEISESTTSQNGLFHLLRPRVLNALSENPTQETIANAIMLAVEALRQELESAGTQD